MTPIRFVKRIAKSGRGFLIWIPKDVADFLKLNENTTVEIQLTKLKKE